MIISCPSCNTRFVVSPTAIPLAGRNVRCARCQHQWFQKGEEVSRNAEVLEPNVRPARPTKPAALPPPKKKATAPVWMKAAAACMAFVFVIAALMIFEKPLRAGGLETVYSLAGAPDSSGMTFSELKILVLPGSKENTVKVSGKIYNGAEVARRLPGVRVTLLDENHLPVETGDFTQENVDIAAGEAVPFNIEMPSRSRRAEYVRLDLGTKLDLMLRD